MKCNNRGSKCAFDVTLLEDEEHKAFHDFEIVARQNGDLQDAGFGHENDNNLEKRKHVKNSDDVLDEVNLSIEVALLSCVKLSVRWRCFVSTFLLALRCLCVGFGTLIALVVLKLYHGSYEIMNQINYQH